MALALGGITSFSPTHQAHAQSAADMKKAKEAFVEGKAAFEKGDYDKAAEKFKESFKLSKNPLLLFNIALTMEKLGTNDMALFYYKKFLSDAPDDAAQRPDAQAAVDRLEAAATGTGDTGDTGDKGTGDKGTGDKGTGDKGTGDKGTGDKGTGDVGTGTGTGDTEVKPDKPKKPKRDTCLVEDFQHEAVDEAPPGKPLDLSAFVSEDATCTVTLYYRGSGEDKFTTAEMKPRYNELVARIPAAKMAGNAIQYYIEVKDSKGELVVKIGKATSPNVVFIDESAKPRYYPDLDEGSDANPTEYTTKHDDDDDPLAKGHHKIIDDDDEPGGGPPPPPHEEHNTGHHSPTGGFFDVGSSKFGYAKWGSTGLAAGGVALSVTFALMASSWASSIEAEASTSNAETCAGGPPCRTFDDYRKGLQDTGKQYETMSQVFAVVGVVGIGIAGYYWYEELIAHKKGEHPSATTTGLRSFQATPVAGENGLMGAAGSFRF
jgi:tetratricopeptide (TPR) repeat protein